MAKVALRFGCAKQSKNLVRYLVHIDGGASLARCMYACSKGPTTYVHASTLSKEAVKMD